MRIILVFRAQEVVAGKHVFAEQFWSRRLGQELHQFGQIWNVLGWMIGMWKITRPEKAIFTSERDDTGQGAFIRVARDPTLSAEVLTWAMFQRHALAQGRLVNCVHTLDPVADPACADLENHHAQFREEVEDSILKERRKTGADGVAQDYILIEGGIAAGHAPEA